MSEEAYRVVSSDVTDVNGNGVVIDKTVYPLTEYEGQANDISISLTAYLSEDGTPVCDVSSGGKYTVKVKVKNSSKIEKSTILSCYILSSNKTIVKEINKPIELKPDESVLESFDVNLSPGQIIDVNIWKKIDSFN